MDDKTIVYKHGNTVTFRKPKNGDYISFSVASKVTRASIRAFLQNTLCDCKDINNVKNDIIFYLDKIYGKRLTGKFADGRIFYVYVYLPREYPIEKDMTSPHQIFPFDMFYIRRDIPYNECKRLQNIFKETSGIMVHIRKPWEKASLPFEIEPIVKV